eukprot:TRINITY_DN2744_c0_g2_i7.p1 TRINITY_DN2744_c0_g2~~TRINITY_DN2744_c0_g2_i7.p1  ORF type:complete len:100 (-),score=27.52 TRINITY_DN2744_c0_g2_i7:743-1000(-)
MASKPTYRYSKKEKAIRAYTIVQESKYLQVTNVPSYSNDRELIQLFALYGPVDEYRIINDINAEPFTKTYWIKMQSINDSRFKLI